MRDYLAMSGDPPEDGADDPNWASAQVGPISLPYRVEVWDATGSFVEQVIALTANRSIGWAAFNAASEQYPQRIITFRDQFGELSRWNTKRH